jgi:hypothetical protein
METAIASYLIVLDQQIIDTPFSALHPDTFRWVFVIGNILEIVGVSNALDS